MFRNSRILSITCLNSKLDHGLLLGLSDDDHPQYIKDSEFTQDSGFLVGTGAGTFQEETGTTLRTSIGVGTGDSPTFTGLTLSSLTQGSVLFAGAGGVVSEDNSDLFWDDTNKRLGIGTASPTSKLSISYVDPQNDDLLFNMYSEDYGDNLIEIRKHFSFGGYVKFVAPQNWMGFQASSIVFDSDGTTNFQIEGTLDATYEFSSYRGALQIQTRSGGRGPFDLIFRSDEIEALIIDGDNQFISIGGESNAETLTEWTHAQPYLTLHNSTHEDTDGGRESRINFKGEQSGGEETTLARIEVGHDGTGDDQLGKIVLSTNTGAGLVDAVRINSDSSVDILADELDLNDNRVDNISDLNFTSATELTISSGEVTITKGHHSIDTESDNPDDDLDTINGGEGGDILLILPKDSAHSVRLRNGVGNIYLKHQVDSSHLSFSSPSGAGAATRYAGGGWYDFAAAKVTLNQGSLTQTFGTANISYAAHASIVCRVNGTVDVGTVSIVVSGTSIDDEKNRQTGDSETILADITAAGTNGYHETAKKWLGTITFTLTETVGDPTAYTIDFNYGFSKYEDFGNQSFTVTGLQVAGEAGANDTNFNMILFYHSPTGWTYAATGFVPGGTQLANMNTDHSTEQDLSNGEPFAWKRIDLNTDVAGDSGEGVVFRVDTSAAKAVESMSGVIWVHTQPAFSYMSDTKQHLIFMKHGPNWLEL